MPEDKTDSTENITKVDADKLLGDADKPLGDADKPLGDANKLLGVTESDKHIGDHTEALIEDLLKDDLNDRSGESFGGRRESSPVFGKIEMLPVEDCSDEDDSFENLNDSVHSSNIFDPNAQDEKEPTFDLKTDKKRPAGLGDKRAKEKWTVIKKKDKEKDERYIVAYNH